MDAHGLFFGAAAAAGGAEKCVEDSGGVHTRQEGTTESRVSWQELNFSGMHTKSRIGSTNVERSRICFSYALCFGT
jgi:hypothetical protein